MDTHITFSRCTLLLSLQLMFALSISAQHNLYITHPTSPETSSVVPFADKIIFANDFITVQAQKKEYKFDADKITEMGLNEQDKARNIVIPETLRNVFDKDIVFENADFLLSKNKETLVADSLDKSFEDFVENSIWDKTLQITYSETSATTGTVPEGVVLDIRGNHVVVTSNVTGLEIILTGKTTDGSFKLYGGSKTKLTLNNIDIHNPIGPAINNQCKKRLLLVLSDNTNNYISDAKDYIKTPDEDMRGCLFSEGQICVSGTGNLFIDGNKKNGMASDDYIHIISGFMKVVTHSEKGDAIKVKDDFIMGGGALQLLTEGNAAKGISSDSLITIKGGNITAIITGDGMWDEVKQDYSSSSGLDADYSMTLSGGEIKILATGMGGKGINNGHDKGSLLLNKGMDLTISGANIVVRTAGTVMPAGTVEADNAVAKTSPKGIKSINNIYIKHGTIVTRCSGGYGSEGLEAKGTIKIEGGVIRSYCNDDGLNAGNGTEITGGDIFACSTDNDGYDVNGSIYIKGGTLYTIGAASYKNPQNGQLVHQAGIDNDGKTFSLTGGTIVGIGGFSTTPQNSISSQASVLCYLDKSVSYVTLIDVNEKDVMTVKVPESYKPVGVYLSSDSIKVGETYKILSFSKLDEGEQQGSVIVNPKYSNAVEEYSFVQTQLITTLGTLLKY